MDPLQAGQYDEEELPAHEPPPTSPGHCAACDKKIPGSGRARARVQYTSLGDPVCDLECWDDVEAEL